jgi:hypothetical protein
MERALLDTRCAENPELYRILRKNIVINDWIDEEINVRLKGDVENFVVILILGQQGSLKTSVAIEKATEMDSNFKADNICFTYDYFKDKLMNSQQGEAFNLDEQVFSFGSGSMRIMGEIQTIIETIRIRKNPLIICSVTNKYFNEDIFTFVLETVDKCLIGICESNAIPHETRTCQCQKHEIVEAYVRLAVKKNGHYIGLYIQKINWNNQSWKDYQPRKQSFMTQVLTSDFQKLDYEKRADELLKLPECEVIKTLKGFKLIVQKNIPKLTIGESELLATQMKLKKDFELEVKKNG